MKAIVKYNSYIGIAAADISESINLKQLLIESGYDGNRYEPLGLDLVADSGNLAVFVICIDKLNFDSSKKNISKCLLRTNDSVNFQQLFKHLNISLFASHLKAFDYVSEDTKIVYLEGNLDEKEQSLDVSIDH